MNADEMTGTAATTARPAGGSGPAAGIARPVRGRFVFEVGGLDCADCARNLERAINAVPGVEKATVVFASARATIHVSSARALDGAQAAARDLGFVLVDAGARSDGPSWRVYLTAASGALLAMGWLLTGRVAGPVSSGLVLLAAGVGGAPIFRAALGAARRRMLTVDILVSLAVTAAVLSGEALAAAQVVVLMGVGELLEERTVERSRRAVRQLLDLAPRTVAVLRDGREYSIPRDDVVRGDLVLVRPGGRVPVDGTVINGRADVSEAPVTGESRLIGKGPGDALFAGSLAQDGTLTVRAEGVGPDTTLARIAAMIEEAQSRQAPVARLVDRFAGWFIPFSLAAAGAVYVATGDAQRGVTILIGACPCALVLSTPVAVYAAIGGASRRGLLIKGGLYLERLGHVDTVAFDKTGTLTSGVLALRDVLPARQGEETALLALAAAVEGPSEHPVAKAILAGAAERGLPVGPVDGFRAHPGLGVSGTAAGVRILAGSIRWLSGYGVAVPEDAVARALDLGNEGFTVVAVARDGEYKGLLPLSDTLRPDAKGALLRLKEIGVATWLLSGDSEGAAGRIAADLGVANFAGGLLPQDKVQTVSRIAAHSRGLAMVGDGINDAPALAAASVGIAVGRGGSDLAIEAADVVLLSNDLARVPEAIELGRKALANIRLNLVLSAVAIAGLFGAAAFGYVGPVAGALVHEGSALLVTLNAMRLLGRAREEHSGASAELSPHDHQAHSHSHSHATAHDHGHTHGPA